MDRIWESTAPDRLEHGVRWPRTGLEPIVAAIAASVEDVVRALGPPTFPDEFLDGIGPMQVWTLRWRCGTEVALWAVRYADRPPTGIQVLSFDTDVDHVLHHVALDGAVRWRIDRDESAVWHAEPERWTLVRQDDHGSRFEVRTFRSRVAAECARTTFEERGHKQFYWIDRSR